MALAPPGPSEKRAEPDVSLLLRRTGFGTTGAEVEAATRRGYEATVEALLHPGTDPGATATPPPDLSGEPARPPAPDDKDARKAYAQQLRSRSAALTLWWLDRMVRAEQPLVERLTFSWHGHWATSIQKVRSPAMMLRQNETLRSLGRGDFRELARAMVRDPALIVWLDGQHNTARAPNENLARELMELFTLGIGHYSENDVREAARALTGWRVDRAHATAAPVPQPARRRQQDHPRRDRRPRRPVAGRPAHRPAGVRRASWPTGCGSGSARRRCRPDTLQRLVAAYGPGRDVTALLRALFLDPAFRADPSSLVEQPVECVVGVVPGAARPPVPRDGRPGRMLLGTLNALGQVPFRPPSVGGWPGGVAWLSTAATQGAADVRRRRWPRGGPRRGRRGSKDRPEAAARLLGVDAWTDRTRAALTDAAADPVRLVTLGLVSPEYLVR